LIREKTYQAWEIPVGMDPHLETEVLIQLSKSGSVTQVRLSRSSGISAYDQSALAAAKAVRFVKPLPAGYGKASEEFIIVFKQR
jgi:TonB family protein